MASGIKLPAMTAALVLGTPLMALTLDQMKEKVPVFEGLIQRSNEKIHGWQAELSKLPPQSNREKPEVTKKRNQLTKDIDAENRSKAFFESELEKLKEEIDKKATESIPKDPTPAPAPVPLKNPDTMTPEELRAAFQENEQARNAAEGQVLLAQRKLYRLGIQGGMIAKGLGTTPKPPSCLPGAKARKQDGGNFCAEPRNGFVPLAVSMDARVGEANFNPVVSLVGGERFLLPSAPYAWNLGAGFSFAVNDIPFKVGARAGKADPVGNIPSFVNVGLELMFANYEGYTSLMGGARGGDGFYLGAGGSGELGVRLGFVKFLTDNSSKYTAQQPHEFIPYLGLVNRSNVLVAGWKGFEIGVGLLESESNLYLGSGAKIVGSESKTHNTEVSRLAPTNFGTLTVSFSYFLNNPVTGGAEDYIPHREFVYDALNSVAAFGLYNTAQTQNDLMNVAGYQLQSGSLGREASLQSWKDTQFGLGLLSASMGIKASTLASQLGRVCGKGTWWQCLVIGALDASHVGVAAAGLAQKEGNYNANAKLMMPVALEVGLGGALQIPLQKADNPPAHIAEVAIGSGLGILGGVMLLRARNFAGIGSAKDSSGLFANSIFGAPYGALENPALASKAGDIKLIQQSINDQGKMVNVTQIAAFAINSGLSLVMGGVDGLRRDNLKDNPVESPTPGTPVARRAEGGPAFNVSASIGNYNAVTVSGRF